MDASVPQSRTGDPLPVEPTLVRFPWIDYYLVVAYLRDLRELKAQEQLTRQTEEAGKLMLDAAPFACTIWGRDMRILDYNAEALRLLGASSKEGIISFWEHNSTNQPDEVETI